MKLDTLQAAGGVLTACWQCAGVSAISGHYEIDDTKVSTRVSVNKQILISFSFEHFLFFPK